MLHQPWVHVVLSGAATTAQLAANLQAATLTLRPDHLAALLHLAEPAHEYWQHRSRLAWT